MTQAIGVSAALAWAVEWAVDGRCFGMVCLQGCSVFYRPPGCDAKGTTADIQSRLGVPRSWL